MSRTPHGCMYTSRRGFTWDCRWREMVEGRKVQDRGEKGYESLQTSRPIYLWKARGTVT